ncbi:MAG: AI-2E family transporter, partial [Pseudomonadota bacterium]
ITFFVIMVVLCILLMPLIYDQMLNLIHKIPIYIEYIQNNFLPNLTSKIRDINPDIENNLHNSMNDLSKYAFNFLAKILENIWSSGIALLNIFSLIFITPIVIFYLLRDFDIMMDKIKKILPKKHLPVILEQVDLINLTLAGYIRGQTNVCLILGSFYAIALLIVGLNFGLAIGFITGILAFIPYVGVLIGMTIGVAVAFVQYEGFAGYTNILIVVAIFLIGQFLEGNFVSPKLVGDKVNLHPVWIIFGMLAGAQLLGFVGVLLAIPVTATIGVLVRFVYNIWLEKNNNIITAE